MYKSPLEQLVSLLTIDYCVICNNEGSRLCRGCYENHSSEPDFRCYMCNKLTRQGRVCKSCKSRSKLRYVWWLGSFKGELKELIVEVKYQRSRDVARVLGAYLEERLPYMNESTLIVPLPTASSRVRRRGFDQAKIIARSVSRKAKLEYRDILIREGQQELIGKRRVDRLKMMQGVFRVKPNVNLKDKTIILVDDVLTTGASLESAATVLRKAGAKHVDAAVVARRLLN